MPLTESGRALIAGLALWMFGTLVAMLAAAINPHVAEFSGFQRLAHILYKISNRKIINKPRIVETEVKRKLESNNGSGLSSQNWTETESKLRRCFDVRNIPS
jgi:hypothetical protein